MLEYKLISSEVANPKVYVATNTSEFVNIYDYKSKVLVQIWDDDIGVHTKETFKKSSDTAFKDVIRWIETQVCMAVKFW